MVVQQEENSIEMFQRSRIMSDDFNGGMETRCVGIMKGDSVHLGR